MARQNLVTLIIAYFNEEAMIGQTISSLLQQTDRRFELVLVDNNSSDRSTEVAREVMAGAQDIPVRYLQEPRRGQLHALAAAAEQSTTPYIATLDADTYYPSHYVERALALLESNPGASAALAFNAGEQRVRSKAAIKWVQALVWPAKCHSGGAGHCYRRTAYLAAGGFDAVRWPYILFDHELAYRLRQQGPFAYSRDHVIHASERPDGSTSRSWSLSERALYKLMPRAALGWYFYRFLGPRLERRGLRSVRD
ncbi:glycosyltransferase family 2 protein [Altererythrobacter sp. KTW20L]|uniref:glycosyltransferase n=1 Tax=Altererythrobacter sp. KTW20L TaxID=2942210 RepID=UPI0020BDDF9B|nr:glycosyltransferase family A protein [Altererythrobacter sp. KTW20L]MCL6249530.1 glycosyltransferase family 2 protein [Altererythrobacter sp. KTW20L]